jgi:hypothetical protein
MDNVMKKIFFILLTLAAFIGYAQNNQHKILYDNNGKVLLNSAGTQVLSTEEGAVDGYNYTPNPEWIPVHGVADNEIWILAFNNGDRYSSFTCTVGSSADYAMDIIGGADGKTLLQTIDTASGKPINFQIPSTGGKWCSSEGYYTFKLRIYAVNPANNILTFALSKHPSTTTTYNRWKIINFGTKSLTSIDIGSYYIASECNDLLYANTFYCTNISGNYGFYKCIGLTDVTMPETMNIANELASDGNSSFYGCTSLKNVAFPISMNNLIYLGEYDTFGRGVFSGCTSLTTINIQAPLPNLKYLGGRGNKDDSPNTGAFYGCTSLTSVTLPDMLNSLLFVGSGGPTTSTPSSHGAFENCTSLTSINGMTSLASLLEFGNSYTNCTSLQNVPTQTTLAKNVLFRSSKISAMTTFQYDSLTVRDFLLTGTSDAVRSNIAHIYIDWANSNFGGTGNIDIRYNSLSATELDRIFTALPTVTGTHVIDVRSNIGAATCNTAIAAAKGWTVNS